MSSGPIGTGTGAGGSNAGEALGFTGVPGVLSTASVFPVGIPQGPDTPGSVISDESDFIMSPSAIATSSKKFWTESSSWIARMTFQTNQSNSSGFSSLDRPSGTNRDPTAVERSNLLNITKLVIKELIEWSIRHGRSLEADHPPLQHFFIVLEHAMRHGLKPKKGLLGPKKELWDVLQVVEKCTPEAIDITSSIRDLPTVSTHIGRARAWLRLALMQKKLADYFRILLDNRDEVLKEFYEPIALMMSDESTILSGLLVGLNVIDCNFCLKEEDLDSQQGVIDFSLYLRSSHSNDSINEESEQTHIDSVLDQKNYIEELNRHLNATCTNLQTRVETLTTTNALMKEDLAISKNTILSLQDENRLLKLRLDQFTGSSENIASSPTKSATNNPPIAKLVEVYNTQSNKIESESLSDLQNSVTSPLPANLSVTDLSKKLHEERTRRSEIEKEMDTHISQKSEMEEAMKLLEKDIHEKQDTIISLRRQLDDIKSINLEMYKKLQECEKSLKYKAEFISKLESKETMLTETIQKLDEKIAAGEQEFKAAHETMRSLGSQIADKELKVSTLESDLRIEREWRQSLQDTLVKDKERIAELNVEVQKLHLFSLEIDNLEKEKLKLIKTCKEQEQTLMDMGIRLSESTLQMEDLREAAKGFVEAQWTDDKEVTHCSQCDKEFSIRRRKHHCRACGKIYCSLCSDNTMQLASSSKPVRVCDTCYTSLLQRCHSSGAFGSGSSSSRQTLGDKDDNDSAKSVSRT